MGRHAPRWENAVRWCAAPSIWTAYARWCFVARAARVYGFATRARHVGTYRATFLAFEGLERARRAAEHD